jgi:hypothetical protein
MICRLQWGLVKYARCFEQMLTRETLRELETGQAKADLSLSFHFGLSLGFA